MKFIHHRRDMLKNEGVIDINEKYLDKFKFFTPPPPKEEKKLPLLTFHDSIKSTLTSIMDNVRVYNSYVSLYNKDSSEGAKISYLNDMRRHRNHLLNIKAELYNFLVVDKNGKIKMSIESFIKNYNEVFDIEEHEKLEFLNYCYKIFLYEYNQEIDRTYNKDGSIETLFLVNPQEIDTFEIMKNINESAQLFSDIQKKINAYISDIDKEEKNINALEKKRMKITRKIIKQKQDIKIYISEIVEQILSSAGFEYSERFSQGIQNYRRYVNDKYEVIGFSILQEMGILLLREYNQIDSDDVDFLNIDNTGEFKYESGKAHRFQFSQNLIPSIIKRSKFISKGLNTNIDVFKKINEE